MADGKNIEIRIAATGGDQAAAEVKKVVVAEEALVDQSKRTNAKLDDFKQETNRVTRSNVQMGTGFQNVGYQLQDFAVQVGGGTSALRAFSQQAPQLLSGFGPWGLALGTVAAIAGPLAGAMFSLGDSTEEAGKKASAAADKLDGLQKKRASLASEKSADKLEAWLDALDDEEQAIENQNTALERQIELLKARRAANQTVEDARREARIANIQADPNKSDADKIREVAAVREEGARADAQTKLYGLASNRRDAAIQQQQADAEAKRAREDQEAANAKKTELEKEKADLKGRVTAADAGKTGAEATRKALLALDKERTREEALAGPGSGALDYSKREAKLKKELEQQERASQSATDADRRRLNDPKALTQEIKDADEGAKAKKAAADAAAQKAIEAREAVKQAEELQKIKAPAVIEEFTQLSSARKDTTAAAAREAEQRAKEKKVAADKKAADEASDRQRQALEDRRDSAEVKLDSTARERGLAIRGKGLKTGNDTLAQIGKSLSDGTDSAEIQKIGDLVKEKQGELGAAMVTALKQVLAGLDKQAKEIEIVKGQIKNSRR